ncbi:hypothetical protein NADFUDRAFT_41419 [Nadsonia fulvescens var. elongata DSM 6958]|uniref:Inheritance of peroxisomes protein 1 n=1 Tax=Nadsonia fulvescens var. elongata DSM 6958 TaxID=857566 RepID=A0A1E3PMX5_9ASCO|nr:hypothetical protein NADFUDRAFT_41419 [Nadsonia fulvescens var. elongata DSM 6958]
MEAGPQFRSGSQPSKVVRRAVSLNDLGLRKDVNIEGDRDNFSYSATGYLNASRQNKRYASDFIPATRVDSLRSTTTAHVTSGAQRYSDQGQLVPMSKGVAGIYTIIDEVSEELDYSSDLRLNRGKNERVNDDEFTKSLTLFELASARITQFSTSTNAPPSSSKYNSKKASNKIPVSQYPRLERIVAEGVFQIYTIHNGLLTYLRCGSIVHPILPRLKLWRTGLSEFILPQPISGKYWRIEVDSVREDVLDRLDHVLNLATAFYTNVYVPDNFSVRMNMVKKFLEEEKERENIDRESTGSVTLLNEMKTPVTKSSIVAQMVGKFDTLDISTPRINSGFQQHSAGADIASTVSGVANKAVTLSDISVSKPGHIMSALPVKSLGACSSSVSSASTLDGYLDSFRYDFTSDEEEEKTEKSPNLYWRDGCSYNNDKGIEDLNDLNGLEDLAPYLEPSLSMNSDEEYEDFEYDNCGSKTNVLLIKKTRCGPSRINNVKNRNATVDRKISKASLNSSGTNTTILFSDSMSSASTLSPSCHPLEASVATPSTNLPVKIVCRYDRQKPRWASLSQVSDRTNHASRWAIYVNTGQTSTLLHTEKIRGPKRGDDKHLPSNHRRSKSQSQVQLQEQTRVHARLLGQVKLNPKTNSQQQPLSPHQVLETLLDSSTLSGCHNDGVHTRQIANPYIAVPSGRKLSQPRPKSMYDFSVHDKHDGGGKENMNGKNKKSRSYLSKVFAVSRGWTPWG